MVLQRFAVAGMSCEHCVNAVTAELERLPGVEQVDVDLEHGLVTVTAGHELDTDSVAAAVDEAGYELDPRGAATGPMNRTGDSQ